MGNAYYSILYNPESVSPYYSTFYGPKRRDWIKLFHNLYAKALEKIMYELDKKEYPQYVETDNLFYEVCRLMEKEGYVYIKSNVIATIYEKIEDCPSFYIGSDEDFCPPELTNVVSVRKKAINWNKKIMDIYKKSLYNQQDKDVSL